MLTELGQGGIPMLDSFALRDIVGHDQPGGAAFEGNRTPFDFNINEAVVFFAMPPDASHSEPGGGPRRRQFLQILDHLRTFPFWPDIRKPHRKKLLSGVAVMLQSRIVDFKKT